MAVHGADDGAVAVDGTSRGSGSGSTYALLTAILAVVVAVCLWLLVYRFVADTDDSASTGERLGQVFAGSDADAVGVAETQEVRETLMSQANQFVLRVNTYGPGDLDENNMLPGYAERVREVITSKFSVSFDQNLTLAEQSVSQAGYARDVEIVASGVESVEDDRGVVLVAGTINGSYPDPAADATDTDRVEFEPQPFRFRVSLVRTEGEWLVDDFAPLSSEVIDPDALDGGIPAPTEVPSAEPSDQTTRRPTQQPTRRPSQQGTQQGTQQGSDR